MSHCVEYDLDEFEDMDFPEEISANRDELCKIVSKYILNYFDDKGLEEKSYLLSPKYIDMCIDTNICDGVDRAYEAIERSGKFETSSSEHSISEDIRFVIKTLGQIKKYVPQDFAAGILLMHLEILEGIPL